MKLRMLLLLAATIQVLTFSFARAQIIRPIDPAQKADIDTKSSLNMGDAQFPTIAQPTREEPNATLPKGQVHLQNFDTKQVQFKNLEMSTIEKPVLPQANFTAKNLALKTNDANTKNLNQAKEKAPITKRQLRPFAPGGEEELKKQLNEPPLSPR